MAATNEHRIVAKVVTSGEIQPLLERGVDESWFLDPEERDALGFVLQHYEKYGQTPDKVTFGKQMGANYQLFKVRESFAALLDDQAETCQWYVGHRMLPEVEDALKDAAVGRAIDITRQYLAKMESFTPAPTVTMDSMDEARLLARIEDYDERAKHPGGIVGYSTGFPTIDKATMGLQAGQLMTVLAQPKVGKTSICLCLANHIYVTYEATVLFMSFEMSVRELEIRQEALMAGVPHGDLLRGTLDPAAYTRYSDWIEYARTNYGWPYYFMDASGGSTVSAIRSHVERYDPAILVIDGLYMLHDEVSGEINTSTALTNITRSLKKLAVQAGIPVVINTQALGWKSKGVKITMDSAGYSSSFGQDSDVILGLERIQPGKGESEATHQASRTLRVLASRSSGLAQVELRFDYPAGVIEEVP